MPCLLRSADPQKQHDGAAIQVLPTQLIADDSEGKFLCVRLIMKEGLKYFSPVSLFRLRIHHFVDTMRKEAGMLVPWHRVLLCPGHLLLHWGDDDHRVFDLQSLEHCLTFCFVWTLFARYQCRRRIGTSIDWTSWYMWRGIRATCPPSSMGRCHNRWWSMQNWSLPGDRWVEYKRSLRADCWWDGSFCCC